MTAAAEQVSCSNDLLSFTCCLLAVRWLCRQAACKGCQNPMLSLACHIQARPNHRPSGTVLSICTALSSQGPTDPSRHRKAAPDAFYVLASTEQMGYFGTLWKWPDARLEPHSFGPRLVATAYSYIGSSGSVVDLLSGGSGNGQAAPGDAPWAGKTSVFALLHEELPGPPQKRPLPDRGLNPIEEGKPNKQKKEKKEKKEKKAKKEVSCCVRNTMDCSLYTSNRI